MNHYDSYNCAHSDTNASMSDKGSLKKKKKSTKGKNGGAPVKLSTDPQSVAARERRHRISERFKTLQSMVPGGAKLDTVSMLDEAIHYVKFLKTQIWLHETLISSTSNSVSVSVDDRCNHMFHQQQQQQQPQLDHALMHCCHQSVERSQCSVDDGGVFGAGDSSWGGYDTRHVAEVQFGYEAKML